MSPESLNHTIGTCPLVAFGGWTGQGRQDVQSFNPLVSNVLNTRPPSGPSAGGALGPIGFMDPSVSLRDVGPDPICFYDPSRRGNEFQIISVDPHPADKNNRVEGVGISCVCGYYRPSEADDADPGQVQTFLALPSWKLQEAQGGHLPPGFDRLYELMGPGLWQVCCASRRADLDGEEPIVVAGYALETMEQFARQLLLSPPRLRLQQITGAEYLINLLEPRQTYPYDLVVYHVTQYRPKSQGAEDPSLPGRKLIGDLVQLVDDLTASVRLRIEQLRQPCYTAEQLGERLRISPKTINRWRQRGLVSYRVVVENGRRRKVFPDRALRRFVSRNPKLVQRASSFSKLTEAERDAIIAQARELLDAGKSKVSEIAVAVAEKLGRSTEAVRFVLRRHDQEHPEDRLFDRGPSPLGDREQLRIYRLYQDGDRIEAIARHYGREPAEVFRTITELRARELLSTPLAYVPSEEFDEADAEATILGPRPAAKDTDTNRKRKPTSGDLPPYLRELYDMPLLAYEQERDLFRRYNYTKCKAARLAESIEPRHVDRETVDELERLIEQAHGLRNELVRANLRLVVSIAKKHVRQGEDLFTLVSDGNVSLMKAVEKFDYSRGFKFSTYASWAIMKNYARSIPEQRSRMTKLQTGHDERLDIEPDPVDRVAAADRRMEGVRQALNEVLGELPDRERTILIRHYGLAVGSSPETLEEIGKTFGVSKERARQLEKRALKKLREMVSPSILEAVLD